MKALIVDDSRAARSLTRGMLERAGVTTVEARDALEAWFILETDADFAFAVVDWNMPVISGIEFVARVRADARFATLPILMATSEIEMSRVEEALAQGACEYLMKPFDDPALIERIRLMGVEIGG